MNALGPETVDSTHRVDIFLSFHGRERLACGLSTRGFMRTLCAEIETLGHGRKAHPHIYFDETAVQGHVPSDIFTALLQARGGGLGICFLTEEFFHFPWCVAELRAMLRIAECPQFAFRLRFFCLECEPGDIIQHGIVREFVDNLRGYAVRKAPDLRDPDVSGKRLAELIWKVLDGEDGTADRFPAVLGRTCEESLLYLQERFLRQESGFSTTAQHKAVLSYCLKWERSKFFPWHMGELNSLIDLFWQTRQDIWEFYRQEDEESDKVDVDMRGDDGLADSACNSEVSDGCSPVLIDWMPT